MTSELSTTTTAFLGVAHIHTPDFVARLHARDDVHVAAVFDHDAARSNATQREFPGCRTASSAEEILADPAIQSVIVCSETVHHLELVVAAANAGKHIFCEKPLGLGAADAQAMAAAVKTAGVLFQTGFFFRGKPAHQFMMRELRAGNLGTPTRARYGHNHMGALARWFDRWAWFTQPKLSGGGALLDLGAHCMDLIVHLFGSGGIRRVAATLGNRVGHYGSDIDEYGVATLAFDSGMVATIEASWVDGFGSAPMEVYGTEGSIRVVGDDVFYASKRVPGAEGGKVLDLPAPPPHPFELFWDAIRDPTLSMQLIPIDDAAAGSALMERLYQSAGRSTTAGLAEV